MIRNQSSGLPGAIPIIRTLLIIILVLAPQALLAQSLLVKWEELSSAEFVKGIQQSQGTCLLPIGIMEKHGLHLPLGNDLINVRYASLHAAEQEYTLVFPEYYFSQSSKHATSLAPWLIALVFNSTCCRRLQTRWGETVARKSS